VRGWRAARLHDSTGHGRPHTQCQRPTTVAQFQTTSDALSAAHTTPRARVPCARERVALEERPACDVPKAIHAPRPPGVVLHTPRATHEWCCDAPHRRAMMGACAQGWKQECGWRRTSAQEQRASATADAPASHGGRKRGFHGSRAHAAPVGQHLRGPVTWTRPRRAARRHAQGLVALTCSPAD